MDYKFHKVIEKKEVLGLELENCIIVTSVQYFPDNKEIHICFENILHDHDTDISLKLAEENKCFYANIITEKLYSEVEKVLFEQGIIETLDYVYEIFKKGIFKKFGFEIIEEEIEKSVN